MGAALGATQPAHTGEQTNTKHWQCATPLEARRESKGQHLRGPRHNATMPYAMGQGTTKIPSDLRT
eukprot:801511-Lingulodinium_polyedra.AAC.1